MARTLLGALAGLLAFLLAAEALCRLLPVSSATKADYHIHPKILSYAPDHPWRYATGWDLRNPQRLRTNRQGFVSDHDFVRDESAVVLVGDSYVEAASLDAPDRPAAQLQQALGGQRKVYAMGAAGTALLDYAERMRWAQQNLGTRDFVLLMERGDVLQALCNSGNVHSQCLDAATLAPRSLSTPPASALKRLLRESALAQYLVSQLKIEPARLLHQAFSRSTPGEPGATARPLRTAPGAAEAARTLAATDAVAQAFFKRIQPLAPRRLVIMLDTDRPALQAGRALADDAPRQRFITLARAAGAVVIDAEPLCRAHFARSRLSLDIGPYDGHLNPLGVKLYAQEIARALAP